MGALLVMTLIGIMTYTRIAFMQADVKTAVRLVKEVQVDGRPLAWRINQYIPDAQQDCIAEVKNKFFGHMLVTCQDASKPANIFQWSVNVTDGMVVPANTAAKDLGEGKEPWPVS